jgi:hypothetical protein
VVAEGLELGNGPTRFSSLVAAPGHVGLKRESPGCYAAMGWRVTR